MECVMKLAKWDSLAKNTLVEVDNDLNLLLDDTVQFRPFFSGINAILLVPRSLLGIFRALARKPAQHSATSARLHHADPRHCPGS